MSAERVGADASGLGAQGEAERSREDMSSRRQKIILIVATTVALLFLCGILVWQRRGSSERWDTFLVGDPRMGAQTFQQKGCSGCHSVLGAGAKLAPDLGLRGAAGSSMNELVTQMWNHAPRMWKQLKISGVSFPQFTPEDMANLFAYLYVTCYDDESGNRAGADTRTPSSEALASASSAVSTATPAAAAASATLNPGARRAAASRTGPRRPDAVGRVRAAAMRPSFGSNRAARSRATSRTRPASVVPAASPAVSSASRQAATASCTDANGSHRSEAASPGLRRKERSGTSSQGLRGAALVAKRRKPKPEKSFSNARRDRPSHRRSEEHTSE